MGRALVREPTLFLFDEPLSNLDAKLRVELRGEIKRLHERLGTSIVYVTHDQIEAMTLGTVVVVLNGGIVQQIGSPQEIYERPANLFVADFMGSPPMNLLPATATAAPEGAQLVFGNGQRLLDPNPPAALQAYSGKPVILGVRPESMSLGNDLRGTVSLVENSGSDTFVTVNLGGKSAICRLPGRRHFDFGREIGLALDLATACYFDPQTGVRI